MSISLSGQLLSLAAGLLLGVGVGLLYDLLRQLRLLAPRRWMAEGLDLLFWLLACLALFLCGILFGGGQVRLYMVLWLTLGAAAYFAALSEKTRRLLAALAQGIGKIFRVLLAPLRWLSAVLLGPWIYFFGDAKIFLKKVFSFSAVSNGPRGAWIRCSGGGRRRRRIDCGRSPWPGRGPSRRFQRAGCINNQTRFPAESRPRCCT